MYLLGKQIVAQESGHEYQRLVLWMYINQMLAGQFNIKSVYYEYDEQKGFDDIVVEYKKPIFFNGNREITKEYIQVKYHVHQDNYISIKNLIDPKFINASRYSYLDNVKTAFVDLENNYEHCIFTLYTPYDIEQGDTLYRPGPFSPDNNLALAPTVRTYDTMDDISVTKQLQMPKTADPSPFIHSFNK